MAVNNFAELIFVSSITGSRHFRRVYQLVCDAPQCGNHHNYRFFYCFYNSLYAQNTVRGTYGRSAEFYYFHILYYY